MPRPRPQANITTGRPPKSDYQSLTPRTPHSHTERPGEASSPIELQTIDDDGDYGTYAEQQSEPLLASSASDGFPPIGYRSHTGHPGDGKGSGRREPTLTVLQRIPLALGTLTAGFLFILIVISMKWPETLEVFMSSIPPVPSPALEAEHIPSPTDPNLISYRNYTHFPLTGMEYRKECEKMGNGFMKMGDYWDIPDSGVRDVIHHDEEKDYHLPKGESTKVCKSTVTYMLDGHVGLLADLALMAQAAALAQEVRVISSLECCPFTSITYDTLSGIEHF
jgi:hypothetical protein